MDLIPFGLFCALAHVCKLTRVLGVTGTAMSLPRRNDSFLSLVPRVYFGARRGVGGQEPAPLSVRLPARWPGAGRRRAVLRRPGVRARPRCSVIGRHVTASGGVTDPARVRVRARAGFCWAAPSREVLFMRACNTVPDCAFECPTGSEDKPT